MSPYYSSADGPRIPYSLEAKMKKSFIMQVISFIVVLLVTIGPFIGLHFPWLYSSLSFGGESIGTGQDSEGAWLSDNQVTAIEIGDDEVYEADRDDDEQSVYTVTTMLLALGVVLAGISVALTFLARKGRMNANNAMIAGLLGGILILIAPIYFVVGIANLYSDASVVDVIYTSEDFEGMKISQNVSWGWILSLAFGIVTIVAAVFMRDPMKVTKPKKEEKSVTEGSSTSDFSFLMQGQGGGGSPPATQQPGTPIGTAPSPYQQNMPQQPGASPPGMPQQPPGHQPMGMGMPPQQPGQQQPPGMGVPQQQGVPMQSPGQVPGQVPYPGQQPPPGQQIPSQTQPMQQSGAPPPNMPQYQPQNWTCRNCQTVVEMNFAFCTRCGAKKGS